MASSGWRTNSALSTLVFERYDSFNVFQLVRVLLWKLRQDIEPGAADPLEAWPIERRLRFRADLSDAFPGREFSQLSISLAAPDGKSAQQRMQLINISTPNY